MSDTPRLIERAFPLKQASLDSVHEKNVRHGHISTLHIWPARRPLAACRAALIATLLPDPGTPEKRQELCEKIGGKVVKKIERKKMPDGRVIEREKEETEGGILHWKRETENAEDLEWFRQEIRKAYGGRAPRVLDPFAGGGAIPLEAMRLGCEATAADINPVAWFIQKCTLEYPQKLAGKTLPLPEFILENEEFMGEFYKAHPHLVGRTKQTKQQKEKPQPGLWDKPDSGRIPKADLAWHVRAWGKWVLNEARCELAIYYPTYADFEPLDRNHPKLFEKLPMQLVPLTDKGTPDIKVLNAEFSEAYLNDKRNPRWVAKPTVAYLWARTVTCKNCRATVPLQKTLWLCKKDNKRVLLTMEPKADQSGVTFDIQQNVPQKGGNSAQKREHDKRLGNGTMSRAGAKCPCCSSIMTMEDIRFEGKAGRLGVMMTAVVMDGQKGKEYRIATDKELILFTEIPKYETSENYQKIILGLSQPFAPASTRSISAHLYGVRTYSDLFTIRQKYSLAYIGLSIKNAFDNLNANVYPDEWKDSVISSLCLSFDRLLSFACMNVRWKIDAEAVVDAFSRFSISLLWDFAEAVPTGYSAGCWELCFERIATALDTLSTSFINSPSPHVIQQSADEFVSDSKYDLVITDPPYYQAISYADLSDFFYTWLRSVFPKQVIEFELPLSSKEKEIVQHIREDKSRDEEKNKFENRMAAAFGKVAGCLEDNGRFVVVFAHKDPIAWETLVAAIIKAGFVVIGSWPIATEMQTRQRASACAALSSSVWLICKKRPITAKAGWDNNVMEEMRLNISERLREYWDAGIRGPDFVWAATGPAMEAYSKHPAVKKANEPGQILGVSEFLTHVRRMVVDYVVGQVLTGEHGPDLAAAERMDAPTAYYLLHRHDFGLEDAPVGACILYATACGLSDHSLDVNWDILSHAGSGSSADYSDEETETDSEAEGDGEIESGSKVKLKVWSQRKNKSMGFEAPGGQSVPLIDRVHRLMHLWKAGDAHKVDEYLDDNGLRRQELFKRLLQSLIELSSAGSEERILMESLSNHIQAKGATPDTGQVAIEF